MARGRRSTAGQDRLVGRRPVVNFFSRPELENVLADAVEKVPNVLLGRGVELREVTVTGRTVKHRVLLARYVVGCDGANAFVRQHMSTSLTDLGYFDWLIVDTIPLDDLEWPPMNWQLCDPVPCGTRPILPGSDLVLDGAAEPGLLHTYAGERSSHLEHAITMSVALGRTVCVRSPLSSQSHDARRLASSTTSSATASTRAKDSTRGSWASWKT